MAKKGFKAIDSDPHVIEPVDIWQRYLEPVFKKHAPLIYRPANVSGVGLAEFKGQGYPTCDLNARER